MCRNRFSQLEVEDVDESFHLSPTDVALTTRPTAKQPDSVDVFELEAERAFDDAFAVFCFFEDLHRIQDQIRKTWENCESGKITLVAATTVTETAVHMIRRAEQDLCIAIFPHEPTDDAYQSLAGMMILVDSFNKGLNPMEGGSGVEVTPFDDFIFLPAARILLKFIQVAAMSNAAEVKWPAPIPPLTFNYIHDPSKVDKPEHKKLQHDDQVLSQVLLDLQLPDKARKYSTEFKDPNKAMAGMVNPPHEDIFLRTLRPVWAEGKVSVTAVVVAQAILDILDTCKVPQFYRHLKYAHQHESESFKFKQLPGRGLSTGDLNWPNSGTQFLMEAFKLMRCVEIPGLPMMKTMMLQVSTTPKMYTWDNAPPQVRAIMDPEMRPPPKISAAIASMNLKFIQPAPADDFALVHNPMYSGSVMLKLLLNYHDAGLSLANHHLSIFATAHLYNALRQLRMLPDTTRWPLMERIMELHKRAIFADLIPTRTRDIADRLSYRLDVKNKQKRFYEDEKYKLREPSSTQVLRSMLDTEAPSSRVLWQIEHHTEQVAADKMKAPSSVVVKTSKSIQPHRQWVTLEGFFKSLSDAFSQPLDDLSIDYIRLTKHCIRLLDNFRKMWNAELQAQGVPVNFESQREGANTNDIGHLVLCLEAFEEAKKVREMGLYTYRPGEGEEKGSKSRHNDDLDDEFRHGMGLLVASKVVKSFLAREDGDFRYPLARPQDAVALDAADNPSKFEVPYSIRRITSAAELQTLLSSTTYAIVDFYTDYDGTHVKTAPNFGGLAFEYGIPGVLEFARANMDDLADVAKKYCQSGGEVETFVFLKEGKQVAVNGRSVIKGADKRGLMAAAEKLGGLAKKRA